MLQGQDQWVLLYSAALGQASSSISFSLVFDVDRGPSLLFGIGSAALPSWDQKSKAVQSDSRPDSKLAADPGPITNSPHPSSREGHRPTSGGSLLLFGSD